MKVTQMAMEVILSIPVIHPILAGYLSSSNVNS